MLQRLQFSRATTGSFGTFWDASPFAEKTRKPLNHPDFLRFLA